MAAGLAVGGSKLVMHAWMVYTGPRMVSLTMAATAGEALTQVIEARHDGLSMSDIDADLGGRWRVVADPAPSMRANLTPGEVVVCDG